MSEAPAPPLLHPALGPARGAPPEEARVTDRQRLAALLQGAALLAHLRRAGAHLVAGWKGARVDGEGGLSGLTAAPGREVEPPQARLRALLRRLFRAADGENVAGRGEARRAARELLALWALDLAPLPVDETVAQVLAAAPFLWQPAFAGARRALLAEIRRGERAAFWVAGPAPFRRRLLAQAGERSAAEALLAGGAAREIWIAATGAVDASGAGAARRLFDAGHLAAALRALSGRRAVPALVLRAACQVYMGRHEAAVNTLRRLETARLEPAATVEAAEVAVRALANTGDGERPRVWVERALEAAAGAAEPALRARAELVAAEAAWDRGDLEAMDRHLAAAAAPAAAAPAIAWRLHHARGLRALAAARGSEMVEHLGRALAAGRRQLRPFEAGALWNELGLGRAQIGDLAGAERAFLHAARLLGRCQTPRATTLALYNLAEIRVRRGRLLGVRAILERSTAESRLAGNRRGLVQDHELWARFELAQGRPAAALVSCREARRAMEGEGFSWRRPQIAVLAARALGWLGRAAEAAAELEDTTAGARAELEPEERWALWAHAGRREEALRETAEVPAAELWQALLSGGEPEAGLWRALEALEPYRAARAAFDADLLLPGVVPPNWRRRAVAALRRAGAASLAQSLESRDAGPWRALARYLERGDGQDGRDGAAGLGALFEEVGHGEARLLWRRGGEEEVLVPGAGGGEELAAPLAGGVLALEAPRVDEVLRALFPLALRELTRCRFGPGAGKAPAARSGSAASRRRGGMVGEDPALAAARARLEVRAPGSMPVLILGESGTGKELAARRVHAASPRAARPFVPLNCAALSEALLMSDLFGHVRGSFTGADRDRAGVFETAAAGTVFLDEIGDLPPPAQGMLLRVLQEGEVRRVGESVARKVDVRVVAATHRDLAAMVEEGSFRRDLYFRLKVAAVTLPPLRERGDDVLRLAEHFLRRGDPAAPPRLSAAARARLRQHSWPGNVRELGNVLEVAAALAGGGVIEPEHLDLPAAGEEAPPAGEYHQRLEAFRRRLVEMALEAAGGNRAEAARRLGLTRQALSYLAKQMKLT